MYIMFVFYLNYISAGQTSPLQVWIEIIVNESP